MAEEKKVAIKELTVKQRIVKISNEIRLQKDGTKARFEYFRPDDIMNAINPLLLKYDLITIFDMGYSKEKEKYEGVLTIEDATETDETKIQKVSYKFDISEASVMSANASQNDGATQTYCKRYMLMNAFNIADNDADPDANQGPAQAPANDSAFKALVLNATRAVDLAGLKDARAKMEKTTKYTEAQKKEYIAAADARIKELETAQPGK